MAGGSSGGRLLQHSQNSVGLSGGCGDGRHSNNQQGRGSGSLPGRHLHPDQLSPRRNHRKKFRLPPLPGSHSFGLSRASKSLCCSVGSSLSDNENVSCNPPRRRLPPLGGRRTILPLSSNSARSKEDATKQQHTIQDNTTHRPKKKYVLPPLKRIGSDRLPASGQRQSKNESAQSPSSDRDNDSDDWSTSPTHDYFNKMGELSRQFRRKILLPECSPTYQIKLINKWQIPRQLDNARACTPDSVEHAEEQQHEEQGINGEVEYDNSEGIADDNELVVAGTEEVEKNQQRQTINDEENDSKSVESEVKPADDQSPPLPKRTIPLRRSSRNSKRCQDGNTKSSQPKIFLRRPGMALPTKWTQEMSHKAPKKRKTSGGKETPQLADERPKYKKDNFVYVKSNGHYFQGRVIGCLSDTDADVNVKYCYDVHFTEYGFPEGPFEQSALLHYNPADPAAPLSAPFSHPNSSAPKKRKKSQGNAPKKRKKSQGTRNNAKKQKTGGTATYQKGDVVVNQTSTYVSMLDANAEEYENGTREGKTSIAQKIIRLVHARRSSFLMKLKDGTYIELSEEGAIMPHVRIALRGKGPSNKRYHQSEQVKQAKKHYKQTEQGKQANKQANKRYEQSEKGQRKKQQRNSEQGKQKRQKYKQQYNQSEHGKRKIEQYREDNKERISEEGKKQRREKRTQESRATAEMMRAERDEYKDDGSLHANQLLFPIIDTQDAINSKGATVLDYCTPTPDDPNHLNDSDAITVHGCGEYNGVPILPARIHVNQVPPEKMQKMDGLVKLVSNKQVTDATKQRCGIEDQWKQSNMKPHDKVYAGIHVEKTIKFHFSKWRRCYKWNAGDVIYIYVFFSTNDVYDSFYQVRIKHGNINRDCALMSGTILEAPPCACLKATLGSDEERLTDTEFEFIRINGDMEKEVCLKLDDEKLVVTPYGIEMK